MNQRDRLIGWIMDSVGGCARHWAEVIADGILKRGGLAPPCKVGEEVYCISPWRMLPDRIRKETVYRISYEESRGFAILTDKGVYFDGECFHTKVEAENELERRASEQ